MKDLVKNSIEARKNAFFASYDIKNKDILNKIEDLFNRINELGEKCNDITEFESEFANSPLNQEYINLFTEIATTCSPEGTVENESTGELIMDEITNEIKDQADSATHYIKRQANQEVYDKVRDIPGVGEVLEVKQYMDLFGRFKKKKDSEDEENEEK